MDDDYLLLNGDCIEKLKDIPDRCIDLLLVDLPYGTTACKWDSIIPLDELWKELNRVCKSNAAMVFTAQQPFTWKLCASNPDNFRYELIWEKPNGTNPFQARIMPMKKHENILVFYRKQPVYNPQMQKGKPYKWSSIRTKGEAGGISEKQINDPIDNKGTRYPSSVMRMKQERGLHPTQKPVELMKYLIKTYSNIGDVVLDCTMGSGTTGVAAIESGRKFIGIELENKYFIDALKRIRQSEFIIGDDIDE
jgi:site-specific DNA-methyltransferase (adenine-specific)